jgi:hypothetical protein
MMNLFTHFDNTHGYDHVSSGEYSLEKYFESQNLIPAYSIFLGLCDDGVPLILDLTDSNTGSFLIAGDNDASNYKVLSSLLTSAYCFNSPKEINIHLISHHLDDYSRLLKTPHLNLCLKPDQIETSIAFEEFANLGKQRKNGDSFTPYHLIAVDRLDVLLQSAYPANQKLLTWLIENGPDLGMYVIATIESSQITPRLFPLLNCFPSRILNEISNSSMARYLSGMRDPNLSDLVPGLSAVVFSGNRQNRIRIPNSS